MSGAPRAAVLAVLAAAAACSGEPAAGEKAGFRNLLLVTFDTTRADRIGAYGYAAAATPTLDRLAAEGVLFEHCIATAPITLPSHASILTGLYPFRHGARNNGTHRLPEEMVTLAEILQPLGFATGAVVSAIVLDSRYGLAQGFDRYDDLIASALETPVFMLREAKAADATDRALRFLEQRGAERWFLWVHYFDPHAVYQPPEPYAARFAGRLYDGEIAYADAEFGRLIAELGRRGALDRTLVVATADHGEALGEHDEGNHGLFLYDATTRVPLIFRHPALAPGARHAATVSTVDVLPTVLELLGATVPAGLDGVSLARSLRPGGPAPRRAPAYQEAMTPYYQHGWSDLRALRDDWRRYVRAPREELYDLAADPGELHNLLPGVPQIAQPYQLQLQAMLQRGELDSRARLAADMDPAERAQLAELGYVWDAEPEQPAGSRSLPDPKDRARAWHQINTIYGLVNDKSYQEAERALSEFLAENPDSGDMRATLALVLERTGRKEEAVQALQESLRHSGTPGDVYLRLAVLERELGRPAWRDHLALAQKTEPPEPLAWVREGDWAAEDGELGAAMEAYQAALALDEFCADAWEGIGNALRLEKRYGEAAEALGKAVRYDPGAFDAWFALGLVYQAEKRLAEALECYHKAVAIRPGYAPARIQLGNQEYAAGRLAEAEEHYRTVLARQPRHFEANFNLGKLLFEQSRHPEAVELLRLAAAARPEEAPAWRQLLFACSAARRPEEALDAAQKLLALQAEDVDGLLGAAIACAELGRAAEARAYLERARAVDSQYVEQVTAQEPRLRGIGGPQSGG